MYSSHTIIITAYGLLELIPYTICRLVIFGEQLRSEWQITHIPPGQGFLEDRSPDVRLMIILERQVADLIPITEETSTAV